MATARFALWVWYRGECFRGFQKQTDGPTVQGALGQALRALGVSSSPLPAGRTDKGVHARMQVVRIRSHELTAEMLRNGVRTLAPIGLGVCLSRCASPSFHPQWACSAKEYRYRLRLGRGAQRWSSYSWAPGDDSRLAGRHIRPDCLAALLKSCVGSRDFSAFHERSSPRRLRTIFSAHLLELGDGLFEARLRGDRFGRYQVRYLIGSALAACTEKIPAETFVQALETGAAFGGLKAPAHGLILWEVFYPAPVDPFTPEDRRNPEGMPREPPFSDPSEE